MEPDSEQDGAMPDCSPQEFPAIHKVLSIFLTTPVGSVSCERSFSALRRLKLWTRSSMTERSTPKDLLYLATKYGGRGLKSVESTYKNIKVKTAIKLYASEDPTMCLVREFEEKCERTGRRSLKKDTERYASERGLYLKLSYPCLTASTEDGQELPGEKVGAMMRIKEQESRTEEVRQQK